MLGSSGSHSDLHPPEPPSEIVLCYRRDTAGDFAYILYQHLTASHYQVFWDQNHPIGNWHARMQARIQSARVALIMLVNRSDLTPRLEDYFLDEIIEALRWGKAIIPVMHEGFQWPDSLPSEIKKLKEQRGIRISHASREADLQRLTALLSPSQPDARPRRQWMLTGITVTAILAAALVAVQAPTFTTETPTVTPLTVYSNVGDQNAIGNWTLYMPENAREMIALDLSHTAKPFAGHTAIRLTIQLTEPWWCGIGTTMPKARRFPHLSTLGFWARGERGNEQIQVKVGVSEQFPDGLARSPWLSLSPDWQHFEIPISTDLAVTNLFTVVTDRSHNPSGQLTVFLDEIVVTAN